MKTHIYIFFIIVALSATSCSSFKELSEKREITRAIQQEHIIKAIDSQMYIIKATRLHSRRMAHMDLKPDLNFIAIKEDIARVNLAYIGRSYSNRAISGINFTGKVIESDIIVKKKGAKIIKLKIQEGNDRFSFYIHVSSSGDCSIDINHPRLDNISYRGYLSAML